MNLLRDNVGIDKDAGADDAAHDDHRGIEDADAPRETRRAARGLARRRSVRRRRGGHRGAGLRWVEWGRKAATLSSSGAGAVPSSRRRIAVCELALQAVNEFSLRGIDFRARFGGREELRAV